MELPEFVQDLRQQVTDLAALIDAPANLLPTYVQSEDLARPHIEWEGQELHLVVRERGSELERWSSANSKDIAVQTRRSPQTAAGAIDKPLCPAVDECRYVLHDRRCEMPGDLRSLSI
jgi:hypothetical protein